jgi:protein-disulfide isomerase
MFRTSIVIPVALMGALVLSSPISAEESPYANPAWQQAVEKAIETYIRSHPEVIEQTLQALEAKRQAVEQERVKAMIATRQSDLLNDPNSPVSGNLKGDVTIVEFFDYRCGFCKRVAGAVTQLQKDDARVRVVYKNFPILGEASELAAKAALASNTQGRYQAFHEALLAAKGELTKEQILHIATEVGLDMKRLETDMENPEWTMVIDRNRALARELGIGGTPAFIVGNELYPGAMELAVLKDLIARTRVTIGETVPLGSSKAASEPTAVR